MNGFFSWLKNKNGACYKSGFIMAETGNIILAIVVGVLFILIVLQIIYIRATFATYDKEKYRMIQPASVETNRNTLKAYALVVNVAGTSVVNEQCNALRPKVVANTYLICGGKPSTQDIEYTSGLWLVLEKNTSSTTLISDIVSQRTTYVMIDNIVCIATYDMDKIDEVKQRIELSNVQDKDFVFLSTLDDQTSTSCEAVGMMQAFRVVQNSQPLNNMRDIERINVIFTRNIQNLPIILLGFTTIA